MSVRPVGVTGTLVDIPGVPGRLVPPQNVIASVTLSVLAEGRPILTAGAIVAPHGNYTNPKAPGYNPPCAKALVTLNTIKTITVEGKPLAVLTSICSCGHIVLGTGAPSVVAGGL